MCRHATALSRHASLLLVGIISAGCCTEPGMSGEGDRTAPSVLDTAKVAEGMRAWFESVGPGAGKWIDTLGGERRQSGPGVWRAGQWEITGSPERCTARNMRMYGPQTGKVGSPVFGWECELDLEWRRGHYEVVRVRSGPSDGVVGPGRGN
jgi:hypothetical protein